MAQSDPIGAPSSNTSKTSDASDVLAAYAHGQRAFSRRYLAGANLQGANLADSNFYDANFTGADLSGADLSRANLMYAKLTSANLRGANLSAAFLDHADLTNADTTGMVTDRPTPPAQQPAAKSDTEPAIAIEIKPSLLSIDTSFCVNCGTALHAEDKFCPRCGTARRGLPALPSAETKPSAGQAPAQATSSALQRPAGSVESGAYNASSPTRSIAQPAARKQTGKQGLTGSDVALLILGLLGEGWSLIIKLTLVVLVIAGGVIFVQNVFAPPLTEHSSCQQFEQADSDAQTKVLQDMMAAHHDTSGNIQEARLSVNLYCNVYGPSAPIDGIYSGNVGGQQIGALNVHSGPMDTGYSRQSQIPVLARL